MARARVCLMLALVCWLGETLHAESGADDSATPAAADTAQPLSEQQQARVTKLIGRLQADSVTTVRTAFESLRRMGDTIVPELDRVYAASPDEKLKDRILHLIDSIKVDAIQNNAVRLETILDEVGRATRGDMNAEKLEALLDRLVKALQVATDEDTLELPVRFGDVGSGEIQHGRARNQLIVESKVNVGTIQNSIVLADTVANINRAHNCIIIARIAANVRDAQNCIVLTGAVAETRSVTKCVVLSQVAVQPSIVRDSMLGASEPIALSSVDASTVLINTRPDERAARRGVRGVVAEGLVIHDEKTINPLAEKVTITLATAEDGGVALFRLSNGSGEYVARVDQDIHGPNGAAVAELAGWKLQYAGKGFVVFGDGERYSYLPVRQ